MSRPWAYNPARTHALWDALVEGTAAFIETTPVSGVVIGLSGGIDSAVVAAVAVDALGAQRVRGVAMPGPFSSEASLTDAAELADRLGIRFDVAPIGATFDAAVTSLVPDVVDATSAEGVAFENLQARLRGMFLMTVANFDSSVVLNTGNRSEAAVGYTTLHGDMVGAVAPIGAVFKTDVFDLARWRNTSGHNAPIPQRSITRAPSAELAAEQTDEAALLPYPILDAVLAAGATGVRCDALAAAGADREVLTRVDALVAGAAFKSRFAPPAVQVPAELAPTVDLSMFEAFGGAR